MKFIFLISLLLSLSSPSVFAKKRLSCLHPEICLLMQDLVKNNSNFTITYPLSSTFDGHQLNLSLSDLKNIMDSEVIVLPPQEVYSFTRRIKNLANDSAAPKPLVIELEEDIITAGLKDNYAIKDLTSKERHLRAHLSSFGEVLCAAQKKIVTTINKHYPQASLVQKDCPFSAWSKDIIQKLQSKSPLLFISTHGVFNHLVKAAQQQSMDISFLSGHNEANSGNMQEVKKTIETIDKHLARDEKASILFVFDNPFQQERFLRLRPIQDKKREFYLVLQQEGDFNHLKDEKTSYLLLNFLNKLKDIFP